MPDSPTRPAPISRLAKDAPSGARRVDMRAQLRAATSAADADILTGLREIVRSQVRAMAVSAAEGPYSAAQASALQRVAQTYRLLAAGTAEEQARYDLTRCDTADLEAGLAEARRLLQGT